MNGYLASPLTFLISTVISLYILAVMLRFLFQLTRADFYNPLTQFIVKITSPALRPLRRIIPGWGGMDIAALVLMLLLQMLSVWLVFLLAGRPIDPPNLLIVSVAQLVDLAFSVFIFAILIQAILSWITPGTYNPVTSVLFSLTEPVLRRVRRVIPPISGFDLSPLVAILGLQVVRMLVMPLFGVLAGAGPLVR
ncbi:YggT family protein [Sulfurivermis fontis]|uniref:YggT family protein n=1 Tax=Sulfurivermis fontis TaxID=1972068 RepID=UPI000FDA869C|nr:YggT family protein [Sulfurivermis fontis]